SIGRREIFEQLDFVTARNFYNREFQLSTFDPGNFLCHFAFLMRAVRELESKHVAPECERAFEIRNGDPGVIGGNDTKRHFETVEAGVSPEKGIHRSRGRLPPQKRSYPTAATTLSSIAIGVGNAVTSTVVRVGFGFPGPAKYSA